MARGKGKKKETKVVSNSSAVTKAANKGKGKGKAKASGGGGSAAKPQKMSIAQLQKKQGIEKTKKKQAEDEAKAAEDEAAAEAKAAADKAAAEAKKKAQIAEIVKLRQEQRKLNKRKELVDLISEFNKERGIELPNTLTEEQEEYAIKRMTEFADQFVSDFANDDLFVIPEGGNRMKGQQTLREFTKAELIRRSLEVPRRMEQELFMLDFIEEEYIKKPKAAKAKARESALEGRNVRRQKREAEGLPPTEGIAGGIYLQPPNYFKDYDVEERFERFIPVGNNPRELDFQEKLIEFQKGKLKQEGLKSELDKEFQGKVDEGIKKIEQKRKFQLMLDKEDLVLPVTAQKQRKKQEGLKSELDKEFQGKVDEGIKKIKGDRTFGAAIERRQQFKIQARAMYNQPNADKFGLNDDGTPRSRKDFAQRFRGKSEAEVSKMIDQEVKDRTPEQRGAFLQRAVGTLRRQDITDDGILQAGGNRVGAGEFIASQLAQKDIEQIVPEPSKRGFISAEFTPDNMRKKQGPISQEEEGVIDIRKRREQQYIKEWSADGTTMKATGLATLDQEKFTDYQKREDALLNAVAGNLETVFFKKIGADKQLTIEQSDKKKFEEKSEGSIEDLQNRRFGGIKPITSQGITDDLNRIQTDFKSTDNYLRAQRNYAIQQQFIKIIEKSQQAEGIFSQYQINNEDFTSTGSKDSPYVDTDLNFNGGGGYEARFKQLLSEGQQPLQFLLNSETNEILKFASDNMMSGDRNDNNVGEIAVVNEVNMGGRIAFIGHTRPKNSTKTKFGVALQGGNLRGASYGYMSVFSNPYEENQPLIQQNRFIGSTELNSKKFVSYTQRSSYEPNITGMEIGITVAGGKKDKKGPKRQDVPTQKGISENIFIRQVKEIGGAKTITNLNPDYEQIRKGTFLPKQTQPLDQTTLRRQLRAKQLNAQFDLSTSALRTQKRIGLQGMR